MSKTHALNKLLLVVGLLFALMIVCQSNASSVTHNLNVEITPGLKMIKGRDIISFPSADGRKWTFLLHKNLQVTATSSSAKIKVLHKTNGKTNYSEYGLEVLPGQNKVTLEFSGIIYDPIVDNESQGLISPEGIALFEDTFWYPSFLGFQKNYDLSVKLPVEWRAVTQGQLVSSSISKTTREMRFTSIYPQEEINLVGGAFQVYEVTTPGYPKMEVYLRQSEPSLAQNFLSLLPKYISHYAQEISAYPYSNFAVVENFWETGYGLPSFTLLGPGVLRLPFILNSSLPHEVLHNWWGNGVFVDYEKGNWSEGLTMYMADHWQQEILNQDAGFRLKALINFDDFVTKNPGSDFPLRKFRSRHSDSSQAVGYGKSMMFFHMLEIQFGKDLFRKTLQLFYKENQFKKASFEDLLTSFEKSTGQNLAGIFSQWLDRTSGPELALGEVKIQALAAGGFSTTFSLLQNQKDIYNLVVPITWTLSSGEQVHQMARLNDKVQYFVFNSNIPPIKIAVDGENDLFRKLYLEERPVTLSSVLGSRKIQFYGNLKDNFARSFISVWNTSLEGNKTSFDVTNGFNPSIDGALVLVGDRPEFRDFMKEQLYDQNWSVGENEYQILGETFSWGDTSSVIMARRKENSQQAVVWIRWSSGTDVESWAKRLTHYGSYGVLILQGQPVIFKTNWPTLSSPLKRNL